MVHRLEGKVEVPDLRRKREHDSHNFREHRTKYYLFRLITTRYNKINHSLLISFSELLEN